jgi:DNA-binding IclR family transcriptional regulator
MRPLKSSSVGQHENPAPADFEGSSQGGGVAAVDRALSLVGVLESQIDPQSLSDLSRKTGLYKSTVLRLLTSLQSAGYIARLRDGRYVLGAMAFRLGLAYGRTNPLREHVFPMLERLVQQGTESASFHVRQDSDTRLCLFRVDSQHGTLDRVRAGMVMPLRRGAGGRVLLAFDGEPGAEFDKIRRAGIAISMGETDPSCAAIACPIFGPQHQLKGAISLSGPKERFTDAAIAKMRDLLLAAAKTVTRSLGGSSP